MEYFEEFFNNKSPKAVIRNIKNIKGFEGDYIKVADDLVIASLDNNMKANEALIASSNENKICIKYMVPVGLIPVKQEMKEWKLGTILCNMLCVTTDNISEGAVSLFYPGVLKQISEKWVKKFICIPSSIHEWLLVNPTFDVDKNELNALIQSMNSSYLDSKQVLSDHAYLYDGETNTFSSIPGASNEDKE